MRRWSVAVAVAGLMWCAVPAAAQDDLAAAPRISVADAKKAMDAGKAVVLDVRDPVSFGNGRLPGAILFGPADIARQAASLRASGKTIITYCA